MVMVYGYARGAVVGKTGKTAVLPGFSGIYKGGDAYRFRQYYDGLAWLKFSAAPSVRYVGQTAVAASFLYTVRAPHSLVRSSLSNHEV